tara:strand:- start:226 stop:918 length:693 start_codon:yes stop_codon:yes gene_type:complete
MRQVIAAHGWAEDASIWRTWKRDFEAHGWQWQSADRGYGGQPWLRPSWSGQAGQRLVICHSLGLHLLTPSTLAAAQAIVILGGFAAFVPPGASGRPQARALRSMADLFGTPEEGAMLRKFVDRCASPLPATALPPHPLLSQLGESGRQRLRNDLTLLRDCADLPEGWPKSARTLVVQGEQDAIVCPKSQDLLLKLLEEQQTELIRLPEHGHALITPVVLRQVLAWIETRP